MNEIGSMTNNMDLEKNIGQMAHSMKETISTVKKMALANFCGQINLHIVVISLIIIFMVKEDTDGPMAVSTMVIGNVTRCMVMAHSHGQTAGNMMANTLMIKSRDMVY